MLFSRLQGVPLTVSPKCLSRGGSVGGLKEGVPESGRENQTAPGSGPWLLKKTVSLDGPEL